jgi:hypothetical protein
MLSPEMLHLVNKEKQNDLLREQNKRELVQVTRLQERVESKPYHKAAGWLGAQMVKWGGRLQSYEAAPLRTRVP